jgi:hypothetical protein
MTRTSARTSTIAKKFPTSISNLIPVLTLCAKGETQDGIANFLTIDIEKDDKGHSWRSDDRPIRCLTAKDIEPPSRFLSPDDKRLLSGALALRKGFETGDELLQKKGFEKIEPRNPDVLNAAQAKDPRWARLTFPRVVTERLKDVRLVMWFSPRKNQFTPALWCPDRAAGVFLQSLMDMRFCPYCGDLFLPRKNNVIYCRISHREAHRMQRKRWREKQKQQSLKKGVKRGQR